VAVREGTGAADDSAVAAQRIARPTLAQAIAGALDRGSVLLVAGAGYGKSMALEEAIAVARRRSVWLSCAEADGEAGRLLLTAVEGLRQAVPGLADVVGDRLVAGVEPVDARAAARALLRELESLLVEPLVIVFDDAEQVADSEAALAWISQLLEIERAPLSVAVASRHALPLKLAKLRAAGRVREFGPAELSFSASECEEALRLRARRSVEADIEAVMRATEGWPLGVVLAGLAESDRSAGAVVPRDQLFRYLAEEVLERLDPKTRAALIDSSVPAVLTPDLPQALGLASDFLGEIERQGLFLHAPVGAGGARSYHPLFRDFLLERLAEERTDAERKALQARAAESLAAAGRTADAVEHWLDAGRPEEALSALASSGQEQLRTAPDAVREWLSRLPADLRRTPTYLMLGGQLEWGAGRHEAALAPLHAAVEGFQRAEDDAHEWLARYVLVDALISAGSFDEVVKQAEGWDSARAQRAGASAVGVAWYKVLALALDGQSDASAQLADELHQNSQTAARFRYLENVALLASDLPAGRGPAAVSRSRATIRELELDDPGGRIPYALAPIVAACLDIGSWQEAIEWLERYLRESERIGLGFAARDAHLQRAFLFAREGNLSSAELELAQAGSRRGTGWRGVNRPKAEAQVAALRGDRAEAVAAAQRALARAAPGPILFRVPAAVDMAPLLVENGAPELARAALADALSALEDQFPGERGSYHRARLLATRAWLEFEAGDRESAYESLRHCWDEAGEAVDQLARAHWSSLRPVVWQALADGEFEPSILLPTLETAFAGGTALIELTDHAQPEVRGAAMSAALASSHPAVLHRLQELAADSDESVASAARVARERLRRDPPPLRFELLGRFRVRRGGWEIGESAWERPMAARVVRYLLVNGPSAVTEDALFEAFWADRPADAARQHLAVALSRARKVLDLPDAERSVIEVSERTYTLQLRERDSVDAREFEEAAVAALGESGSGRRASLERATAVWTGEPLPEDRYAPWSFSWRDRLTERYAELLSGLIELYTDAGDHRDTIRTAKQLLELDPLNEEAHRRLMVAYARTGRTNHALRQYLECRRALVGELGVEPAASTSRLQARILAGEAI
jgi:ATP/maltotriose-dependent transcriptional regulator MalT/DNA-binding SARP family transcriptional activator